MAPLFKTSLWILPFVFVVGCAPTPPGDPVELSERAEQTTLHLNFQVEAGATKPIMTEGTDMKWLILGAENLSEIGLEMEGAKDVTVKVLFGPKDNAPTFAMRLFEIAPQGHTPHHTHPFEHEIVVMEGDITLVSDQGDKVLNVGDVAMVMAGEKHQFRNDSESKPAKMLCFVPVEYQP